MAQFDVAKTVSSILSSNGGTAQKPAGKVITTAADMAKVPGVDVAKLAKLPGLENVFGTVQDLTKGVTSKTKGLGLGGLPKITEQERASKAEPIQMRPFNPFSLTDMRAAVTMASNLMDIAQKNGLADAIGVIDSIGELVGEASGLAGGLVDGLTKQVGQVVSSVVNEVGKHALGLIGLRQHALTLFIAHYPPAHEQIKVEPLTQRAPNLVTRAGSRVLADPNDPETEKENWLNFWREDAQLNEHHGQWHTVYPTGLPTATSPGGQPPSAVLNRNGELFAYMHVQMLARYDAERLGVGLPRVKPFVDDNPKNDYRAPILEGYNPGPKLVKPTNKQGEAETWTSFGTRPAMAKMDDLPAGPGGRPPASLVDNLVKFREELRKVAEQGVYANGQKITGDDFGNTIEATVTSVDDNKYGNLHGDGHSHLAAFDANFPPDKQQPGGVVTDLSVAIRDPIFWRWHKHIDTIIQIWRETLGEKEPYKFSSDEPPVTVRDEDIIVCQSSGLPADLGALGAKAFGQNQWDTDFSSGSATATLLEGTKDKKTVTITTTAELLTEMRERTIYPRTVNPQTKEVGEPQAEKIGYLSHEDFFYFIRLQNRSDQTQTVTIRIFLAPEIWIDDNTAWIEMDRFMYGLRGGEHAVVFRPARLSAVIRKPAIGHEELEGTKPREVDDNVWCECGWPYTVLLPRGTREGLDFRLLVMLSGNDLAEDPTNAEHGRCTSMSYCGLREKKYPDKQSMGYPFDRPLPDSIDSIIAKHDNWASRKIKIRCLNPDFDSPPLSPPLR